MFRCLIHTLWLASCTAPPYVPPPHVLPSPQVFRCLIHTLWLASFWTGLVLIVHRAWVCGSLVLGLMPLLLLLFQRCG